jgi:hypothetical protein
MRDYKEKCMQVSKGEEGRLCTCHPEGFYQMPLETTRIMFQEKSLNIT